MSLDATAQVEHLESELASFVSNLEYDELPSEAVEPAERAILDTVGVTLAGAAAPPGRISRRMIRAAGCDAGPASLVGHTQTASAPEAALVNGTAAHALDFDDVTPANIGHPSAPLLSAALAAGELTNASGPDLLTAYVAGFEAAARIAATLHPGHYQKGWHSTGTYGTFSAAAATASLLGLDEAHTRHAINIAASSAAGVQQNFGSMTKPFHAGQAGRAGVTAGLLAQDGLTADPTAITGDLGFLHLYDGPTGITVPDAFDLGEDWSIVEHGVQAKKYPCCYCTHTGIEATSALAHEHGLTPDDVASVELRTSQKGRQILLHDDPATGFEGKFSLPYTVGCAIALDRVGINAFDDEVVTHPGVRRIIERSNFEADPDIPYDSYETRIEIETTAGETYHGSKEHPPGRDGDPLSPDELREKYIMCATQVLDSDAAETTYSHLSSLQDHDADDIRTLLAETTP